MTKGFAIRYEVEDRVFVDRLVLLERTPTGAWWVNKDGEKIWKCGDLPSSVFDVVPDWTAMERSPDGWSFTLWRKRCSS